jgi:hypothetical protein
VLHHTRYSRDDRPDAHRRTIDGGGDGLEVRRTIDGGGDGLEVRRTIE